MPSAPHDPLRASPPDTAHDTARLIRARFWLVWPVVLVCLTLALWLGREVYRDLTALRSTDRDTVQWTLSRVEIEYLDFLLTLGQSADSPAPDLAALREDFDILYSRVDILREGQLFAMLRQVPDMAERIAALSGFLTRTIPLMDGGDDALTRALPTLLAETQARRPALRALYGAGLEHFARHADQQRARLATTLTYLGGLALVMLVGLGAMIPYSRVVNRRVREREGALARANAHMKTILDTALDAVIVSDHHGRVLDLNAAAEATFGYRLNDVRGQSIGDLIVPPELREAHRAGLERMMTTGERKLVGHGRVQLEAYTASHSRIPVELALQSAQGEQGEVVIAFLRDISKQLKNEEDLRLARDKALEGERAKAEFLAVMSHEIRTPLNGLLGNLTLLGDCTLPPEQRQFVQNMQISGRQVMKHVNSVLDIAKFEAGRLEPTPTAFHIGHLMQEIVDAQSGHAERRQNVIEWSWLGPARDWVESDREYLEQLLLNLVGNAIKFTQSGRISLELEQTLQGDEVEIRIIDTGIGIAPDLLPHVFDDFVTSDSRSTGRDDGGTGLGLGIARRLTTLLGGEIGVESAQGEGSVFWLRLPLPNAHPPAHGAPLVSAPNCSKTLHILLAEDNEINAFVAQKLLERDGHRVDLAPDGAQALSRAQGADYDVILMDINMPVMDGIQATAAIRALPGDVGRVPILAFSANVLPADTARYRAAGMDGFLGKPLEPSELRAALMAVSEGRLGPDSPPPSPASQTAQTQALLDPATYDQLLGKFIAEGDALLDLARAAQSAPDLRNDLAQACHKITSSAALFGLSDFLPPVAALETAAKTGEDSEEDSGFDLAVTAAAHAWQAARQGLILPAPPT